MGQRQRGLWVRASRTLRALYPGVAPDSRTPCSHPLAHISVAYVLTIISGGWYLVMPCTMLRADHTPWSLFSLLVAVVFNAGIVLTTASYLLTCFVDPGPVPESWKPACSVTSAPDAGPDSVVAAGGGGGRDSGEAGGGLQDALLVSDTSDGGVGSTVPLLGGGDEVRNRSAVASSATDVVPAVGGGSAGCTAGAPLPLPPPLAAVQAATLPGEAPRFCRYCHVYKPARTHHCGTCNRCVLQFDHHCAFMRSSCIGHHNRKFFILFLAYASLTCAMVAGIAPRGVLGYINDIGDSTAPWDLTKLILLMLMYMLCALHAIVLAGLCSYHLYLVYRNLTTLEHSDLSREDCARYNRGFARNWRAVFGLRPALWFVPVSLGRESDGTKWRFIEDVL
jgi:hypothetical protein